MKKIHFVGIGGIGMSGLARIYLDEGYAVSGSDLGENKLIKDLRERGAIVFSGHDGSNIPEKCDLVVKSTCIRDNNPEIIRSRELDIPVILRGELLKRTLLRFKNSFAVTGTHGKTTTASIISHIMETIGKDPTVLVGGEIDIFGGNAKSGKSDIIVAEVDESDGYFRNISARYAVVTNIEREHMEHYDSMQDVKDSYGQFINNIPTGGFLAVNGEDKIVMEVLAGREIDTVTFGLRGDFNISCNNISSGQQIAFDLLIDGDPRGVVRSPLIGEYNVMNILAAITLLYKAGCELTKVIGAINTFKGVKRRFDRVGRIRNIEVVEDYAHHPTEIRSVIKAASNYTSGRVLTIFQPHRYSRTIDLKNEFKDCFSGSDVLVLTDIYAAHEDNTDGFLIEDLFGGIAVPGVGRINFMSKDKASGFISEEVRDGDIVLILGAGDIREISSSVVNNIKKRTG